MLVLNKLSRYYVAKYAVQAARKKNPSVDANADRLVQEIDKMVDDFWAYIEENGKGKCPLPLMSRITDCSVDPDGVFDRPAFD